MHTQWNLSWETTAMRAQHTCLERPDVPGRKFCFNITKPATKDPLHWQTTFMAKGVVFHDRFYCITEPTSEKEQPALRCCIHIANGLSQRGSNILTIQRTQSRVVATSICVCVLLGLSSVDVTNYLCRYPRIASPHWAKGMIDQRWPRRPATAK